MATLQALDAALEREKASNKKDVAAERAARIAAEAAAEAAVSEAEVKALAYNAKEGLSLKEALERAESLKKRANTILADTRYPEAVEKYTLAIEVRG